MLADRIYSLRRRSGLSQEQLAEKLGVSRQAVSKWEGGLATPELDKLLAMSECFGVSVDYLASGRPDAAPAEPARPAPPRSSTPARLGLALCLAGAAALIVLGLLSLFSPPALDRLDASSAVTLSGSGLLFLVCAAAMALGVYLILRRK